MPKAITLTDDQISSIPLEWQGGLNIESLARKYGVHTIEISDIVKSHFGGHLPTKRRKHRIFTTQEREDIVKMYLSRAHPMRHIAATFATYDKDIKRILRESGIEYTAMLHTKTTPEIDDKIVNSYRHNGLTIHQIKDELHIPYQRVRRVLLWHGLIKGEARGTEHRYPAQFRERLIKTYADEIVSVADLATRFNISYSSTRRILIDNGVIIRSGNQVRRGANRERDDMIVAHYVNNGRSIRCTGRALHLNDSAVSRVVKRAGVYKSSRYTYNQDYFGTVDSHEKAYILGFLITDGCNSEDIGVVSLTLQKQDNHILEQITRRLSPDKPIGCRRVGKTEHCGVHLNCRKMSEDLARLGIVQRKTFKIKIEDWMTGEYANSAILGMMDGDGSFYHRARWPKGRLTPDRSWTFSFIGMRSVCEMMRDTFKRELGINATVTPHSRYKNNPDKPLCTVRVYGNTQNKVLMGWLYKDSPLYLKRKHDSYLEMLEFIRTKRVNQFG